MRKFNPEVTNRDYVIKEPGDDGWEHDWDPASDEWLVRHARYDNGGVEYGEEYINMWSQAGEKSLRPWGMWRSGWNYQTRKQLDKLVKNYPNDNFDFYF